MPLAIAAHLLPERTTPDALAGGTVVVIDVLRATTTITYALAAGCREVIPCLEVDEARQIAAGWPQGQAVLGGERGGLPIEGFHLGNSPADYTPSAVHGKSVVFTTTNGTKAMRACDRAAQVWIGAFVNFSATCRALAGGEQVHLLCAGTRGQITREDVLLAGALADTLALQAPNAQLNDEGALARAAWRDIWPGGAHSADHEQLRRTLSRELRETQGGRNLASIGLSADIDDVAQFDRFVLVGRLDVREWRIVACASTGEQRVASLPVGCGKHQPKA